MSIKRFEIFDGEDGRTYFRAVAGNGEIVVPSEGYQRWQGAADGIQLLLTIPADVVIVDLTGGDRVEFTADAFKSVVDGGRGEVVELGEGMEGEE